MVTHILADGTEVASIDGRVIPPTGKTEAVYRLIAGLLTNRRFMVEKVKEKQHGKEEKCGKK